MLEGKTTTRLTPAARISHCGLDPLGGDSIATAGSLSGMWPFALWTASLAAWLVLFVLGRDLVWSRPLAADRQRLPFAALSARGSAQLWRGGLTLHGSQGPAGSRGNGSLIRLFGSLAAVELPKLAAEPGDRLQGHEDQPANRDRGEQGQPPGEVAGEVEEDQRDPRRRAVRLLSRLASWQGDVRHPSQRG